MDRKYILVINPGSTSTKVAVYNGRENVVLGSIEHDNQDLQSFSGIIDQYDYRLGLIYQWLKSKDIGTRELRAVVGRGGMLRPMAGGTYLVTEKMMEDLKVGIQGDHASNLGGLLAKGIAQEEEIEAYIVDPVAVDEFEDIARVSGIPEIHRKSLSHALNIKAVSYRLAEELGRELADLNIIVAHLGGGISIASVSKGKIIDVNNANEMGPFSPERTGTLPVGALAKMCFSGQYTFSDIKTKIKGRGGLVAYLGTNNAKEVQERIENGDKKAKLVFDAMAYQISKEISAMATVLKGRVDRIILTGGLAYSGNLTDNIKKMVEFIAPIVIYPGGDEQEALNNGVLRVLEGKVRAKIYEKEVNLVD